MARRPPSSASIRSQMRSAGQKFQRDMNSALRKAERDINRELASAQRKAEQDVSTEARRRQRQLDAQARRSSPSTLRYTVKEHQYLGEIHDTVVADDVERDRDLFLCHAWADRQHAARELFDALIDHDVDAWFSEEDIDLGTNLPRQLDRGIRCSRVGLVLVTPAMLMALQHGGFADQELGALLSTNRVIPVLHDVGYAELRQESPLLAARAGLSTADSSLAEVAEKVADSVLAT